MRKYLLSTSAIAGVALMSTTALADVSITGSMEFTYQSHDPGIVVSGASDDEFSSDNDIAIKFEKKTDSGLTIGMVNSLDTSGAGAVSTIISDENYLYFKGGFGQIILGNNDGAGDQLTRTAHDMVGPDALNDGNGSGIVVKGDTNGNLKDDNADLMDDIDDENNITYLLPTMGGLSIGASFADKGSDSNSNADQTTFAAKYAFTSGEVSGSIHYGNNNVSGATAGASSTNHDSVGLDVSTGPFRAVIAKAESEVTATITTEVTDYGIQYNVGNGLTLTAVGTQIEENTGGESSDVTTISAKYNIASGLDAYLTYHDYDYYAGTRGRTLDNDGSYT
ncbi:porin, partial [Alphaproteobacteria bacterium]|nr:porin [Alphaproteobacteria bacterium]